MLVVVPACAWGLLMLPFTRWLSEQTSEYIATAIRIHLKELPGMRKRVEAYVAKSKLRGRRRG